MNVFTVLSLFAAVLGFLLFKGHWLMRFISAVMLIAMTLLCAFGFRATYELSDLAERLPWQIGYAAIGSGSAGLLLVSASRLLISNAALRRKPFS